MPINPTQAQLQEIGALAGTSADGPVVMLNLNRYRARAEYDGSAPDGLSGEVTGREAYERYAEVALRVLEREGGEIVWHALSSGLAVGDSGDGYDEAIAVRYPSLAAFLRLATDPEIIAALVHRTAGLERAVLLRCEPDPPAPPSA